MGKITGFAAAMIVCAGSAWADTPVGLDRLAMVLPGTWKTTGQTFDSAYTKAGPQNYVTVRDCWREPDALKCVFVVNGSLQLYDIFGWDATDQLYEETQITVQGRQPEFHISVKDSTWTYDQEIAGREGQVIHYRITRSYDSATHAVYSYAYSSDGKQWTEIAHGTEERIDVKH